MVCPSLPGYGFSGKPTATGWGVGKIAEAWDTLMVRLGYERYGAQGGDWGSAVTTQIGRNGGHCVAIHTNMPLGQPPASGLDNPTDEEQQALARLGYYRKWDNGYAKQQSTRPQTLGYGLVDSPVGQLAWIVEKFWSWMDCDGHPENVLSRDELLDNVMLYWATASAASSARLVLGKLHRLRRRPTRRSCPRASRPSRRRSFARRAAGARTATTSPTGRRCRAAGTRRMFVETSSRPVAQWSPTEDGVADAAAATCRAPRRSALERESNRHRTAAR